MLRPDERRRFRHLERGLRNTDPDWFKRYHPRRRRYGDIARLAAVALASALLWTGAAAATMLIVFCGVLVGITAATSFVSSRSVHLRWHRQRVEADPKP